ncbi:MAG: hypothetical protein GXP62_20675 [Oligoflexia bacterium]|nr:hypothetical protein [Oligoflexia bacterium]
MIVLLAAILGGTANAATQPWMWGVGPTLGTIVYPGRFPLSVPDAYSQLEGKVRGDVIFGGHGVLYIDGENRLGTHVDIGAAADYNSVDWTLEYERIFVRGSGVHLFGGGGLGFGSYTLKDQDGVNASTGNGNGNGNGTTTTGTGSAPGSTLDDGKLRTPTYQVRLQVGALYKQTQTAEELSIFVKVPLNGNPTWTPAGGTRVDAEGGGNWFHVGLQATVYFGDFKVKGNKKRR